MARRNAAQLTKPKTRRRRKSRLRFPRLWPGPRLRGRLIRSFKRAPTSLQVVFGIISAASVCLALNWIYQVVRKPSELFFPISGTLYKSPVETWQTYAPIFRRHSTAIITPDFLAALAQIEGSGNPVVRTYWRWSLSAEPLELYRPASSAVGMYQITDGTFAEARRFCIRNHRVVADGPWNDPKSCWFNALYTRTVPSHAVELTSAHLHRHASIALQRSAITRASLREKQDLAALIHLCGAGAGQRYAARGLRLRPGQRCGDHDPRAYLVKVARMQAVFRRLALDA